MAEKPLEKLTSAQNALITKYDSPPYVSSSEQGAIPFIDFGGKYFVHGAQYNPQVLSGQTWAQVAAALQDPSSAIAKGADGAANMITATICKTTNNQPVERLHHADHQDHRGPDLMAAPRQAAGTGAKKDKGTRGGRPEPQAAGAQGRRPGGQAPAEQAQRPTQAQRPASGRPPPAAAAAAPPAKPGIKIPPLWFQLVTWALAIAGLGVSTYLTITHYDSSVPLACSDNGTDQLRAGHAPARSPWCSASSRWPCSGWPSTCSWRRPPRRGPGG